MVSYYCQNQQIKEISFTSFPLEETRMWISFDSDFKLSVLLINKINYFFFKLIILPGRFPNKICLPWLTWMSSFNLCATLYVMNKIHNNLQRSRPNIDEKAHARYSVVFKYTVSLCFCTNFQIYLHIVLWDQLQICKCEKVICDE